MESAEIVEKRAAVLEKKATKIEKELYKALAHTSEAEQEFKNQKEQADALSRSTVRSAIKFGEMRLRETSRLR